MLPVHKDIKEIMGLDRVKKQEETEERKGEREGVAQSGPTLYDLTECNPPGSSVHGIFQARILEWVAIAFSWGSF